MYITLVASVKSNPSNTLSRFVTRLPETLHLRKDKDLIGVTEIIFPASAQNFAKGGWYRIRYREYLHETIYIPPGHYESPEDIVKILNKRRNKRATANPPPPPPVLTAEEIKKAEDDKKAADKKKADDAKKKAEDDKKKTKVAYDGEPKVVFGFNEITKHFTIEIDSTIVEYVTFHEDLAYLLGFETHVLKASAEAPHRLDKYAQQSVFYIYSDLVSPSIVGNTRANLLQCCPVSGSYGEMVRHQFNPVRYLDVMYEKVDTISIEILSEQGEPIRFSYGSVVLTLHITSK